MPVPKFTAVMASIAALGLAAPALAAPVAAPTQPSGRALLLIPLTLTKVQDVHFGSVIPHATSQVTVTIDPSSGNRTTSHPAQMFPADPGQRGQFAGAGTPGQQVIIALTPPTELTNPAGDTLTVLAMTLDGPTTRTIAANHSFFVGVGGTIFVEANQPEGLYSATYDLTADYQ